MDASAMPPQRKMRATNNRHIAAEIMEEVLLNLPFKSLVRFSSVSKSWNSMIFDSGFVKRYRGRERIFLFLSGGGSFDKDSTCPLSSISSDNPAVDATDFVRPFEKQPYLKALCDELWLALVGESLFLWNPSMRTYRKLPHPSFMSWPRIANDFAFGLGYDSVGDDYKILKIPPGYHGDGCAELYSLRSDSWRHIQHFPGDIDRRKRGVFVSGKLHWPSYNRAHIIISFDLSTQKFGEVAQPYYSAPAPGKVSVLRGMLCLSFTYYEITEFEDIVCIIWVMEDYGVAESWTKKFSIKCRASIVGYRSESIMPLYYYDNGIILVRVNIGYSSYRICVCKDGKTTQQQVIHSSSCERILGGFLYADSLVAPAMWSKTAALVSSKHK